MSGKFEFGRIDLPALSHVLEARADLALAAKSVWEEWDQGDDGFDDVLGVGGICQDIAEAMSSVLYEKGVENVISVHSAVGENHVFLVVLLEDGVYSIDIPPGVYETGGGYVWKKRQDAKFTPDVVIIDRIAGRMEPDEFERDYGD